MTETATGINTIQQDIPRTSSLWVEKYRPRRVADVEHQEEVKAMLQNSLQTGELPHLLLYGPAGTGKTSMILAFAREMYAGQDWSSNVLELNASDERGIDVIRDRVKNFSKYLIRQSRPAWKLIILDECDLMTTEAQSALRRVMEDRSKYTRFVLICNYLTKIVDAVASRCAKCRFEPLPREAQFHKLQYIVQSENLNISEEALKKITQTSKGDLRMAINTLQNCAYLRLDRPLRAADISHLTGTVEDGYASKILKECQKSNFDSIQAACDDVINRGVNVLALFEEFVQVISEDPKLTDSQKSICILKLGFYDKRLAHGASERLQLLALFGFFGIALTK